VIGAKGVDRNQHDTAGRSRSPDTKQQQDAECRG